MYLFPAPCFCARNQRHELTAGYETCLEGVLGQLFPSWQPSGMVYPLLAAVPLRPMQFCTSVAHVGTAKGMGCWGERRGESRDGKGGKVKLRGSGRVRRIKELQVVGTTLRMTPLKGGAPLRLTSTSGRLRGCLCRFQVASSWNLAILGHISPRPYQMASH